MEETMGFYRRKNKQEKHYGPWYIQYPKETDPLPGKVKYACEKVGFSKRMASRAFTREMLKWQERKDLGLEKKETHTFGEVVDWYLSLPSTRQVKSSTKSGSIAGG
jgi:hypothetical protein